MIKNKFFKFFLLMLSAAAVCSAYEYEAEVVLKDGTTHYYHGSTHDGRMKDHFGHDPADIASEKVEVNPVLSDPLD